MNITGCEVPIVEVDAIVIARRLDGGFQAEEKIWTASTNQSASLQNLVSFVPAREITN